MAYIGRDTDKISNVEVLDNITFDGSSSYTLQKGGSNFTPSSANTLLLSIDGVVQAGNFTVSGSTIDFGTAVAGTSTCDFVLHYGVGLITLPSDGTVTTAKLADSSVTTAKITDANVTSAKMFSGFANGITVADQYRLNATFVSSANGFITSNLEQVDDASFSNIGTAISQSSGVFTFPTTGIYLITALGTFYQNGGNTHQYAGLEIHLTTDNSTYTRRAGAFGAILGTGEEANTYCTYMFDVTSTSTHKAKFYINQQNTTGVHVAGGTNRNLTTMTFIRLGDT